MPRSLLFGATALVLVSVWSWIPRLIADREETGRAVDFQRATSTAISPPLPPCPVPGPGRDTFLARQEGKAGKLEGLWRAVCEDAEERFDRPIIVTANRWQLDACEQNEASMKVKVICSVSESLQFLADPQARLTWARKEANGAGGRPVIWITTSPMAWRGQLVAQYRERSVLLTMIGAALLLFWGAGRRLALASELRDALRRPGEANPPRHAELLLFWFLGRRSRSLPGDLGEEYLSMLEKGIAFRIANRWYRWQVFHSIAPLLTGRLRSLIDFRARSSFLPPRG